MRLLSSVLLMLLCWVSTAFAAERTVILSVPNMQCRACPVAVQRALMRVPGVSKAEARLASREVIVKYEETTTGVAGLTAATAAIGYPSVVRE